MLYKKNCEKTLSEDLFRSPTCEYRGTPFWAWNCKLDKDTLCKQIEYLKEMGFGGFHMHSRAGMATPYLSDEWRELICACNEKAKREKMLAWLYDEDKWPSGFVGGLLTKEPKYRARHLRFSPVAVDAVEKEQAIAEGKTYWLACYDVTLNEKGELARFSRIGLEDVASGTKWYAYCESETCTPWYNNQAYVDTLNDDAIQEFIRMTYDFYLDAVGKDFDGSVPAIFTDEPQFARKGTLGFAEEQKDIKLTWTPDFDETFRASYGKDIVDFLPELFWELPDGKISQIRYFYHDHVTERFARAFADQCGAWCEAHNLKLTGHMLSEPNLSSQTAAIGEAMRSYRGFQLPGIDMLCDCREYTTAKQAQSAAHQYGREGVLSELYGVTNWDFDFRGHKLQGDWQAALGVTVRVPHLSWVSMGGEAKRDYPATFNYQIPWYQEYPYVEDHFARVNTAMTRGKPIVKVGLIHPIESYWLHWGPQQNTDAIREQLESNFQNITKWLLFGQVDFDFICESLLPSLYRETDDGFCVGEMCYDTVLVPACETMRRTTLERLKAFRAKGGNLIFAGPCPKYVDAVECDDVRELYDACTQIPMDRVAVLNVLEADRLVTMQDHQGSLCNRFMYQMRQDGDVRWLFIANALGDDRFAAGRSQKTMLTLTLKGLYTPILYNTLNGEIEKIPYAIENGNTVICREMYQYDSLLLQLRPYDGEDAVSMNRNAGVVLQTIDFKRLVSYRREEDNVVLLDRAAYALDDGTLQAEEDILKIDLALRKQLGLQSFAGGGLQPWVVPEEPISHYATLRFVIRSETEVAKPFLALEHAEETTVSWNGTTVPSNVVGYYVDESIRKIALPPIVKGENILILKAPIGSRTTLEACYLLGDFDVRLNGCIATIVAPTAQIGFGSVAEQGMPFYGGNVEYTLPIETVAGNLRIRMPFYKGALTKVSLDGGDEKVLAYDPYTVDLGKVTAGKHTVTVRLFGNRYNTFASLHNPDRKRWAGPDTWRMSGLNWCYEYRVIPMGVLVSPVLEVSDSN